MAHNTMHALSSQCGMSENVHGARHGSQIPPPACSRMLTLASTGQFPPLCPRPAREGRSLGAAAQEELSDAALVVR